MKRVKSLTSIILALGLAMMTILVASAASLADTTKGKSTSRLSISNLEDYDQFLESKLFDVLTPLAKDNAKQLLIVLDIQANGQISNIQISGTGFEKNFRDKVKAAVETISPLPPLPAGSPENLSYEYQYVYSPGEQGQEGIENPGTLAGNSVSELAGTIFGLCFLGLFFGPAQFLSFLGFTAMLWQFRKLFKEHRSIAGH